MPLGEYELIALREYDVSRELVFRAWITPKWLARWWGPQGFTNTFHECDIRPGGMWKFTMHGPDGVDYPNKCVFVEIMPPQLIVLDHRSGHEFRVTVTFESIEGRTKLTFSQRFKNEKDFEQAKPICIEANEQLLDRHGKVLTEMPS
jgi:uncharacterized protein YndB with AHSA1/START domain